MKIGYIRISTDTQHEDRQQALMAQYETERNFMDICSGATSARPQLRALLDFVREGDTVYIESISRLARSTKDFLEIVATLEAKGVQIISDKEQIDTQSPTGRFMLTVFAAMAELEREAIRARQAEGIAAAKARGAYCGRKPKQIDVAALKRECRRWRAGDQTAAATYRKLGLSKTMFYSKVKELKL